MSIWKKLLAAFFIMLLSFVVSGFLGYLFFELFAGVLRWGESMSFLLIFISPVVAGFVSLFVSWKLLFFDEPSFAFSDNLYRLIFKGVMVSASIGIILVVFLFSLFQAYFF
ncbi:MAG: hypothetical protein IPM39_27110 [Chloroflexi bacterium]|nr:hypothetical protein [Chloroflexota bacterium]